MIQSIGQVMLYMDDTKAAMEFWTQKPVLSCLKQKNFPMPPLTPLPFRRGRCPVCPSQQRLGG